MNKPKKDNSDDLVMTVQFNERTLTWKKDSNGQAESLFSIASNVHQMQIKKVLCDYLHQVAGYPVKKTWLQAIKDGFYTM